MESTPWPEASALLAPLPPWFESRRRVMPWRAANLDHPHPDPYAVLVSEMMLQQTQVATVIPYFERWLRRFPTPEVLAKASEDEVHKAWEGLGYYRRARQLHAAARSIAERGWPRDLEGLLELPGLGPYTAAAVAAIAFQWPEPALDGNAFRVLARILALDGEPKNHAKALRPWLEPALRCHGPSRLTQALMELGATLCGPSPHCEVCPLAAACQARSRGVQGLIPPPGKRPPPKKVELILLALEAQGAFLLRPPTHHGLLAGLWTWPSATPEPAQELAAEAVTAYGIELISWPGWTQVYSHRREEVAPWHLRLATPFKSPAGFCWVPPEGLAELPMGNRDNRLRALLGTPGQAPARNLEVAALLARLGGPDGGPVR